MVSPAEGHSHWREKYKKEMVKSRTHEVQQADEEYDDAYDTGVFSPLLAFCIAHGMDSAKEDNEAAMVAFVEEKFPDLAIEKGKCGGLGVFTSDLKAGEYRYKRGVRASTSHKQKEGMHDVRAARERMQDLRGKQELRLAGQEVQDYDSNSEADVALCPTAQSKLTPGAIQAAVGGLPGGPVPLTHIQDSSASSRAPGVSPRANIPPQQQDPQGQDVDISSEAGSGPAKSSVQSNASVPRTIARLVRKPSQIDFVQPK